MSRRPRNPRSVLYAVTVPSVAFSFLRGQLSFMVDDDGRSHLRVHLVEAWISYTSVRVSKLSRSLQNVIFTFLRTWFPCFIGSDFSIACVQPS